MGERVKKPPNRLFAVLLGGMLLAALLIRLDDLNDPPLDFHPTRQLWSALIARGMYYRDLASIPAWKRQMAVEQWIHKDLLEPRVMEVLSVAGYRLVGREALWIPRLLSSLFWILGGIPLFYLAREISTGWGGLAAAAFYLLLPYAVIASRSFQPEPLMVAALVFAAWALYCWSRDPIWSRAILAGGLAGLAIFLKPIMIFPLFGGMLGVFVGRLGIRRALGNLQVWAITALALLPNLGYLAYGTLIERFLAGNLNGRFFPELLTNPWFYIRWELKVNQVMGHLLLALSLLGLSFFRSKTPRMFIAGLWLGYAAYGLIFNYQTSTHDYYHLPLIPIAALSLSPLVEKVVAWIAALDRPGQRVSLALGGAALIFLGAVLWHTHRILRQADYRPQIAIYENIGKKLERKKKIIALTEDYGYRLAYWGWLNVRVWPSYGDLRYREKMSGSTSDFQKLFARQTAGMDFFLITWFEELPYQPELEAMLKKNYPVFAQEAGYVIYDLRYPLQGAAGEEDRPVLLSPPVGRLPALHDEWALVSRRILNGNRTGQKLERMITLWRM